MKKYVLLLLAFIILACQSETKVDPKSALRELLTFSFKKADNPTLIMDVEAMVVGKEVAVTLPPGSKSNSLTPAFTVSPLATVSAGGTLQESGKSVQDFSKPVVYRVTAEDGSTNDYTVTVQVAKSNEKNLTAFAFTKADNASLPADVSGVITDKAISILLPAGVKPEGLKASFMGSPMAQVSINGVVQVSGTTANDFSKPLVYRVMAEDGSFSDYTVQVTAVKSSDKELLSLGFSKASNATILSDDYFVKIAAGTNSYLLTLPAFTKLQTLRTQFTVSPGATVTLNGVAQNSGGTLNDFSKPVIYRVTAEDGSYKDYFIELSAQSDLATVENAVSAFMNKYNVPGMSVAITKDERLVYAKGYGLADKDKGTLVTTGSLFRVASVSKPITAITILKLVDEGKLSLDQKVFGTGGILGTTYGTQPYTSQLEQITVRHLLSHTAGGDAWNHVWDPANNRIDPFYQKEWVGYTSAQIISATIDTRSVTQTPGSKYVYSNVGINILGRFIEKVTGVKYDKYVQDNILKPVGIDLTTMKMGGTTLAERSLNEVVYYNPYPGYDQPYDFPVPRMDAHSGWITTPVNLVRLLSFADGQSSKKDILSVNSWKSMVTPTAVSIPAGGYAGYGLGWNASNNGTGVAYWHAGGMAGTASYWLKIGTYTFAILVNTRGGDDFYTDMDKLCYQMTSDLTLNTFMKGDQFEVYFK